MNFCPNLYILGSVVKQNVAPGTRGVQLLNQASLVDAQRNKLKEAGGGTFKYVALKNVKIIPHLFTIPFLTAHL